MPKVTRKRLISHTRPKQVQEQQTKWSSKKTRSIIRTHHQLQKRLAQAKSDHDVAAIDKLEAQIEEAGGLAVYQRASTIGQNKDRGGDTSKILMTWLESRLKMDCGRVSNTKLLRTTETQRMLEVGCLKTDNACARSGFFDMKRIDLNSQHPDIEQQDFMSLQPPSEESRSDEGYDLVSLSLVLNYVSTAAERGEMLRHAGRFLRDRGQSQYGKLSEVLPGLFIVLPRPCLDNSRYLDELHFQRMMSHLGFNLIHTKYSAKLVYLLFKKIGPVETRTHVPKKEISQGAARNNFAIVLDCKD